MGPIYSEADRQRLRELRPLADRIGKIQAATQMSHLFPGRSITSIAQTLQRLNAAEAYEPDRPDPEDISREVEQKVADWQPPVGLIEESTDCAGDTLTINGKTYQRITSLEQLVEFCEIDLDVWEVERWTCNKWEVGAKNAAKQVEVHPLFQIKAFLRKRCDKVGGLIDLFRKNETHVQLEAIHRSRVGEHLAVIGMADHHFGKLCWAPEVGEHYDLRIAEQIWREASLKMLAEVKVKGIEKIILLCGNDLTNSDNQQGNTTAGTPQDNDGRIKKVIPVVARCFEWLIIQAREIADVEVIAIPGNHDWLTSYCVALYLEGRFRECPNVNVDINPSERKYREYGINLIGFQHGDQLKPKDAMGVMASEQPGAWGRTRCWEFIMRHLHGEQSFDRHGCITRTCSSQIPPDRYHKGFGYGSRRSTEAFIYHKTDGFVGMAKYSLFPDSAKAAA